MFEGQFSPYGTLALFSRHFAPVQKDWPSNTTATGFCFYDAKGYEKQVVAPEPVRELSYQEWVDNGEAPADWPVSTKADGSTYYEHPQPLKQSEDWKEWMNADEPPFVFALGSSAVFDAVKFWQKSVVLSQAVDERAVFLTGGQNPFGTEALSPKFLELNYAPYSELFPLGKLIVHQGGAGTTAQALRAGVPQLIVPHAHDQPDNAGRISRLGVGRGLNLKKYENGESPELIRKMLKDFGTYEVKARQIGESIRAENGPLTACEAMERVVR
ncbi:glycosyltransferase [bacterium]|nr:MAG: glycosyltransferase [bacterium]